MTTMTTETIISSITSGPASETHSPELLRAADKVGAEEVSEGQWAYYANECNAYVVVDADDLVGLCDYLDSDDEAIAARAYSHWCAGSSAIEMPAGWTPGDEVAA